MAKPVTNPRIIKLIELEASGRIKPEHQQELNAYRAMGAAPKSSSLTEGEGKATGFYNRAMEADRNFLASGVATEPRGVLGQMAADVAPAGIVNSMTSEDRQRAEQAERNFILATLRYESGAAIAPAEYDNQRRTFFPVPGDSASVIAQKAKDRLVAIESLKASAGEGADKPRQPLASPDPAAPAKAISVDGAARFSTDADKSYAAQAQALFDKGASRADIDLLAVQNGYPRYGDDLDKAIAYRERGRKGAVIAPPESGSKGPSLLGAAAATPAGSYFAGAANALTAGSLDELAGVLGGDQAQAQEAKEAMRQSNPIATGVGEVTGGVLASLGVGGLAARALPAAAGAAGAFSPAALAGDAAYGAAYGAGESNDNRLGGAVTGALSGAAGGVLGRGVVNRIAGAVAPNVSPEVALLRDKGVRLTPGQAIGPTASRIEEKLVSIPGVGDLIRNGRTRALGDFNRAVINDALRPLGKELPEGLEGPRAMKFAQQAFDDAYDGARSGMQLAPDAQLAADLADLETRVKGGALSRESANRLANIYSGRVGRRIQAGAVGGDEYKKMVSELGALQSSAKKTDGELADAIGEMKTHIESAARRSSPPEAVAAMDAADEGYAQFVRAEQAAQMRGGDTGVFTPTQYDAAVQKMDGTVRSRGYLRGDALGQDMASAGKSILRDAVPNSGTADRALAGGAVLGAGYLSPPVIGGAGVLGAAYAPGVRDALSWAIAGDRSPAALAAAGFLRDRAKIGGVLGVPLAMEATRR
jgi:hypothetical protein